MKFVFTPRVQTRLADTDTPVSLYLQIREHFPESVLMESGDHKDFDHKYSYICCQPMASIFIRDNHIQRLYPDGSKLKSAIGKQTDVMQELRAFQEQFSIKANAELYNTQGLYGYIGFEAVRYFETIELKNDADPAQKIDDMHFSFYGLIMVFDHFKNNCHIIEYKNDYNPTPVNIEYLENLLKQRHRTQYPFKISGEEKADCSDESYLKMVAKGKEHCYRGDVFQMVLSRGYSSPYNGDDFNVYRALRSINPSPYLFYFDYGAYRLFGSSPEAQLKIENNKASIHPIAGTYKRSGNINEDLQLAAQLKDDVKENAEHTMLVDLARNDLSKNYKDVNVVVYKDIRMFSHVIHIVSEVTGELPVEARHSLKVVADTFPAGTLSGAPKYKALQLIDHYETRARGFYGGSIGFIGFNGDFNQAIMIRTFLSKNQRLFYQAGAGVVASSVAESELQEVHNKLRALRSSLQIAQTLHS